MNVIQRMLAPMLSKAGLVETVRPLSLRSTDNWGVDEAYSGETTSAASVLTLSAVWACVNLLAGTIGSLPLMVYRTGRGGEREVARDHPLYRILHDSPNADQTAVDFLEFIAASIELQGNGYARKNRGAGGKIVGITPIPPDIVTVQRRQDGSLRYRWSLDGKTYDLGQDDVLHVRGFGGGPEGGLSTLSYGRHAFGLAKAVDRAAGGTFRNGMRPSLVLAFKEWLSKERREEIHQALQEKFVGAINAGRPFIAEGGQTVDTLSLKPEDAQMLQSRVFSVEEVCRFFGVPPFMVGHTEKSTSWGTGLEQQTLGFQKFTLRRRLKRIEQAMEKQLLTPQDRAAGITIEFSIEGLLRGDSAARAGFYREMTQIGAMTINEVRALENLPRVAGGDTPRMQMQNVPITEAGRDALPAPTAEE